MESTELCLSASAPELDASAPEPNASAPEPNASEIARQILNDLITDVVHISDNHIPAPAWS